MLHKFFDKRLDSIFAITDDYQKDEYQIKEWKDSIKILWNQSDEPIEIRLDDIPITLEPNQITTTTYLQYFSIKKANTPLTAMLFNHSFYCIQTHDEEVSCNGIIFFGTQEIPVISLNKVEQRKFALLLEVLLDEFQTRDKVQGEMLQVLLKRVIIKCTRLAKEQLITKDLTNNQVDIIRQFNVLVDTHFKEKRQVQDYADLLHKSPKTLSNLFKTYNNKPPLRIIHERIILEAKRLLYYTDKSISDVAFELGYNELPPFSKLFKKVEGVTPSKFQKSEAFTVLSKK
jgi:AraC family 4-hydroxyphenylacetate 3-monooxygenase operon regulatory protein